MVGLHFYPVPATLQCPSVMHATQTSDLQKGVVPVQTFPAVAPQLHTFGSSAVPAPRHLLVLPEGRQWASETHAWH